MKVRKAVQKIVALGIGVTMVGATILGATAADMGNFPDMFVDSDGSFNGLFVVGASAATEDVIGINAITAAVQAKAVKKTWHSTGGGSTVSVEGGVDLNSGTTELYYNKQINDQTQTITDSDLSLLSETTFRKDDGTTIEYEQTVSVGDSQIVFSRAAGNDLDSPEVIIQGAKVTGSTDAYYYEYRATFDEQINLTHADVYGQDIELFGKSYTIGSQTSASNGLVLLGGAEKVTLDVGESAEVESGDDTYVIEILGVSSATVGAIKVNGETKEVTEGNTYNIGGVDVYVDTIAQFGTENTGYVTVQMNTDELYFKTGQRVKVGSNKKAADGTYVTLSTDVENFDTLYVRIGADDNKEDFLQIGDSYTDSIFGTVKIDFTSVNFPLDGEERRVVEFERAADDTFSVSLDDENGNSATVEFVDSTSLNLADEDGDVIHLVETALVAENEYTFLVSGDYQHFIEVTTISVTAENDSDAEVQFDDVFSGESYTVEYAATDWNDGTRSNSGGVNEYDYASKTTTIKGQTYTVRLESLDNSTWEVSFADSTTTKYYIFPWLETVSGSNDYRAGFFANLTLSENTSATANFSDNTTYIFTTPTGDVTIEGANGPASTEINTPSGSQVAYWDDRTENTSILFVVNVTSGSTEYNITTPSFYLREGEDDSDSDSKHFVVLRSDAGGTGTAYVDMMTTPIFTGTNSGQKTHWEEDSKVSGYLDAFGAFVLVDTNDDDQDTASLSYPEGQFFSKVFISPTGAETAEGGEGSGYWETEVVPIPSTASVLDTEVADATAQNMIIVGGPCANSVAATVMGADPNNCAAGFVEGKAKVKLYDNSGKIALLVAGYSATDTRRAATVVANYADYDLTGEEVEVAGTSLTDITVGEPTPVVVEEEVVEDVVEDEVVE